MKNNLKLTLPSDVSQKLLALALPMALTQLIAMGSIFLCMGMLATLGKEVLAASALIFSTSMAVMATAMSILFALSILVSHAFGSRQYADAGQFLQQGWTLAVLISLPVMLFLWHIGSVLIFFGQSKTLAAIVQLYFRAHTLRVLPILLGVCNQQFCYGVHKQKLDIMANVSGVVVMLTAAYVLIFGKFGLPALGVAGLGFAVSIQAIYYFLFTLSCFYFIPYFNQFELFRYRVHQNLGMLKQMFKVGWPISLQVSGEMLSIFACAAMVGWMGLNALAAYQVVTQYIFLVLIPIFAIAQATGVLVGQANGAKEFQNIKRIGFYGVRIAAVIGILSGILFIALPLPLAAFYLDVNNPLNRETVRLITPLFMIAAVSQIFDVIRNVLTGALRGLFDTRYPMFVGLGGIWLLGIPMGYLFGFIFHLGVPGVAFGSLLGMGAGAIFVVRRWMQLTARY